MAETGVEGEGTGVPAEDIGTDPASIVHRWKSELDAARKGPYARWLARAKKAVRRYRDEEVDSDEGNARRRNAQFNVLWSNVQTVAPSVYSRAPKPVAERRYLDRDVLARAGATILQRSLAYTIEDSGFHEAMMQCRTDYFLVGIGDAWLRYVAQYDETAAQHQQQDALEPGAAAAGQQMGAQGYAGATSEKVTEQRIFVDYCHWSDGLISSCRFWSERTWRGKRAYYTRKQLRKLCPQTPAGRKMADEIPLKVTRGKKDNAIGDQVREVIGKAEVWQIWDIEDREVIWICEDYAAAPLKHVTEDKLNLSCFVPSARPVRATTTNDSFWPIPDYSIWSDQAAELDNLTARIAALTRAIKAVGVFDNSQPELERLLQEGSENKLYGVKNWAKLVQRGGLEGSIGMLPITDMANALKVLYLARSQVKNDLYEISGVSDIVRGASDPNETAAAQKMKGQFSSVRGGDRKNEFNRFVRDTLVLMAEVMLEHYTSDMLWLMSDFEQWAKDQDLRAYAEQQEPGMGHNGGPAMVDAPAAPMPQMGQPPVPAAAPGQMLSPESGPGGLGGGVAQTAAPPTPAPQSPPIQAMGLAPGANAQGQAQPSPMAPPVPGIAIPPQQPPAPPQINARALFEDALALLRQDKLRSFRIMVETNSTIEPDQAEDKQSRVEFLAAVTGFLKNAQEMAAAYPSIMPVLGKMLLFGVRAFPVSRELESSLEGMISDLEMQARNPKPKPPSPEELKANAIKQKGETDMAKAKMDAQADQMRMKMEMEKLQAELMALREKMQIELQHLQAKHAMEMEALQAKIGAERESLQIKRESAQIDGAMKQREAAMTMQTQDHEAQMAHEQREGEAQAAREGLDVQREGLELKREAQQVKAKSDNGAKK